MTPDVALILTLSFIIFFAPFIAKFIQLPTIPVEITLGALAGYYGFLYDNILFEHLAEFGFLYLMFLAGSELDLTKIFHKSSNLLKKSIFYILLLYLLSIGFSWYFEFSTIFIFILPLISVGLVATLSKELGNNQRWINYSFNVGGIGEVISITLLTIISAIYKSGFTVSTYVSIVELFAFLFISFVLFRIFCIVLWWFPEVKEFLMPKKDHQEQDLRIAFAILFVFIAMMLFLHLELAFGAFIAGIFLRSFFQHKKDLPEKLSSFGFGFIIPSFFIYIGSTFKLHSLLMNGLIEMALLITAIMITMRIVASFVFYKNLKLKEIFLFSLSHSMPLTLLIAVATLAYHSSSIDTFHYYAFILSALFEVIFAMLLIKILTRK